MSLLILYIYESKKKDTDGFTKQILLNEMVLFPKSGLGKFLLFVIVLSTISYLVLNLVSFGGTPWITYVDVPIRFGLWRVCDTSSGVCNQWADSVYSSNITNYTFSGSKPSRNLNVKLN